MLQARSWLPRTEGSVTLGFARRGERTALETLHQSGAARVRFPRPALDAPPEAVLLNTAGGLTGGDRIAIDVSLAAGTAATLTTAAAEKIYRSLDGDAAIRIKLAVGAGARLDWLPQPTILFDAARLDRRTDVELAPDSRLLATETLIFGRAAMGEEARRGAYRDAWRIRRGGVLVFADTFRLDGAVADALDRRAVLDGARATAMLIYAAPDAPDRLEEARARLAHAESTIGVSAWNGLLLARAIAPDGRILQRDVAALAEWLSGRALPRVWQC